MHSCAGSPKVWMCADSDVRCPVDKNHLAPELQYKDGHAGCQCQYCGKLVGFCEDFDIRECLTEFINLTHEVGKPITIGITKGTP